MNIKLKNLILFLILTLVTLFTGAVLAEKNNELVLFNADESPVTLFQCSTCSWIKGSDFRPELELMQKRDGNWVLFKFIGSAGQARVVFIAEKEISGKIPGGMISRGIFFTIDYPADDFKKIKVTLEFNDGMLVKEIPLEKGLHTYFFDSGWTRSKIPSDWSGLKAVTLFISPGIQSFMLKKISLQLEYPALEEKQIKIARIRKVQEITPGRESTELMFDTGAPLSVKAGYDAQNLYITCNAEFATSPKADFKADSKTGSVWGDELLEFFFSTWNDNQKYIQLVTNFNGVIWNSITDYDLTAAQVITKSKDWSLKHNKKLEYVNSRWTTEAIFPLESLKFKSDQRFAGFQIAQNYMPSRGGKYKTLAWAPCQRFPSPDDFGIIVFNNEQFGSGTIAPVSVSGMPDATGAKINFTMTAAFAKFDSGAYKLRKYITAADNEFTELPSEDIKLTPANNSLKIVYKNCKNLDGVYTLYAALENSRGDLRLFAVNVENSIPLGDMFGKSIFCPNPKQLVWEQGSFNAGNCKSLSVSAFATDRTLKTAEIFRNKLLGFAGSEYQINKGGNTGIILKVEPETVFNGKKINLKPEGYCLEITPQQAAITGADEAGLYYGCITFLQMLRQPMKRLDSAPVRCAKILDWPDLPVRFTNLLHPWQFRGSEIKEKRDINYLIDWVDRYVAGTKQNMFSCGVDNIVTYKRRPEFNAANCLYSLEDLAKLAQFCRDNFIEFVPRWQTGGHADWSLLQAHPELREKGYRGNADVTHPEHNKIVFDCFQDVIEATQCKYINIGGDEWWHYLDSNTIPDNLLRGRTRAEAFLDFHREVIIFARQHKVQVMMHEDMLNPYHNGARYDLYKIIEQFPKEIIILPWSTENLDQTINYFKNKGFRTWPNTTGVGFPDRTRKLIGGYGSSTYSFAYSLPLYGTGQVVNYAANVLRGSEYAWNSYSDKLESLTEFYSSGYMPGLIEMFAEPARQAASQSVKPLDISKAFNCSFNQLLLQKESVKYVGKKSAVVLPSENSEPGNIKMQFASKGEDCIRIGQGAKILLPINDKLSSLIFLHTVRTDESFLKDNEQKLAWRRWLYGRPSGDYYVHYADGSQVLLPLRLQDNIYFAGANPKFRSCINCRYIMTLKDAAGDNLFLYQWEWVNPHPEKVITGIELTQTVVNFDLLLFAISGREVKIQ